MLIRVSACTGPNRLVTPRSSSSAAPFELPGAGAGSVAGLSEVLIVLPMCDGPLRCAGRALTHYRFDKDPSINS